MRPAHKLLLVFGGLSLIAVALGAWVCAQHGIAPGVWARNLVAWVIGAAAAVAIGRWAGPRFFGAVLVATTIGIGATLVGAGQLGVHRWIALGPLTINVAMLIAPAAVVAVAVSGCRLWPWLAALACLALLVWQPDASQATAFGAALVVLSLRTGRGAAVRRGVATLAAAVAAIGWLRPDPLAPVPEVEEILWLAYGVSPAVAAVALAALVASALTPATFGRPREPDVRAAAVALSVYFLLGAVMPFLGAFPTPLVGVGLSPVLGDWLGVGALAAMLRLREPGAR
ncbi:hypothetical protein ACO2Q0_04120 [Phenylobacterium sp. VNQ135]|uniref:hypothetical protein n=1 Tax=Phenylobacterium sp. VNQ135 TaxID=3400922 RepID=UPI003C073AD9